jgi:5-bromo-4-chloroindolyl phosphate hydrolysis protein
MKTVKVKSVLPVYLTALTWVILSFFLSMFNYTHLLITAVASVAVYFVSSALLPKKEIKVREEFIKTGNSEADNAVAKAGMYINELERLKNETVSIKIEGDISAIIGVSKRMTGVISKNTDLAHNLASFMDYYFPTVINLLDSYTELTAHPQKGENVTKAIGKIEGIMDTVVGAFNSKLDDMYSDKALDISAEVSALKSIIEADGLGKRLKHPKSLTDAEAEFLNAE